VTDGSTRKVRRGTRRLIGASLWGVVWSLLIPTPISIVSLAIYGCFGLLAFARRFEPGRGRGIAVFLSLAVAHMLLLSAAAIAISPSGFAILIIFCLPSLAIATALIQGDAK
jgi:hypothetical protein